MKPCLSAPWPGDGLGSGRHHGTNEFFVDDFGQIVDDVLSDLKVVVDQIGDTELELQGSEKADHGDAGRLQDLVQVDADDDGRATELVLQDVGHFVAVPAEVDGQGFGVVVAVRVLASVVAEPVAQQAPMHPNHQQIRPGLDVLGMRPQDQLQPIGRSAGQVVLALERHLVRSLGVTRHRSQEGKLSLGRSHLVTN